MRLCRICQKADHCVAVPVAPGSTRQHRVNQEGKRWNGNTCPACHRKQVAAKMKAYRQKKKDKETEEVPQTPENN